MGGGRLLRYPTRMSHEERRPEPSRAKHVLAAALLWLLAAIAFVMLRVPYLEMPLERDEGEYAYIAQRILADGAVPYRDAFNQKTPASFAVYALALSIGGDRLASVRWLGFVWMALTTLAVGGYGRRCHGEIGGGVAALAFAILSSSPVFLGPSSNTEMLSLLPMVAAIYLTHRGIEEPRLSFFAAAGGLAMLAFLFKQLATPLLLLPLGFSLLATGSGSRARNAAAVCIGFIAVLAPVFAYFTLHGALRVFLDDAFLSNLSYGGQIPLAQGLGKLLDQLRDQAAICAPVWALALGALAIPWIRPDAANQARQRALLWVWLVLAFAGASVGFHYRPHYFMLLLPPLCLLAAGTVAAVLSRARGSRLVWLGSAAAATFLLVPTIVAESDRLRGKTGDELSRELYGLNPFPESVELGRLIRERTETDQTVFVWGSEPQILFYAGRRSATRYILSYPLMRGDSRSAARQIEAFREVEAARPRYVVLVRIPTSHLATPTAPSYLLQHTQALIEREYTLEGIWILLQEEERYRTLLDDEAREYAHLDSRKHGVGPAILLYRLRDPDGP